MSFAKIEKGCQYFTHHNNLCKLFATCENFSPVCTTYDCKDSLSGEVTCPVCEKIGKCQTTSVLGVSFLKDITECHKVW